MSRSFRATPWLIAGAVTLFLAACGSDDPDPAAPPAVPEAVEASLTDLADSVRILAAGRGIGPLATPAPVRPALVALGQALAFDKILSGNRDISCMTCHLPAMGTGDARSLSIGQGATGLGPGRVHPGGLFIPRNAPPLFNLAAVNNLFLDGRVSVNGNRGFHTPAGRALNPAMKRVLEFGSVSAVPLFPVLSREEMRAVSGNELADIPDAEMKEIWSALMRRLGAIPAYRRMFEAAYPGTRFERMNFGHASNAIAGFLVARLTLNDSPWDRFLAGRDEALTRDQLVGARDFMSLKCSVCHNGPAFTDDEFHNVAVAQLGPGKGNGPGLNDDFGRFNVKDQKDLKFAFRTPGLRNVVLTAPYGHDGAIIGLRDFIAHYSESDVKLRNYDPSQLEPALQGTVLNNVEEILATRDTIIHGVVIPDSIVDHLTAFMGALTDDPRQHPGIIPDRVPSGLPIDVP